MGKDFRSGAVKYEDSVILIRDGMKYSFYYFDTLQEAEKKM